MKLLASLSLVFSLILCGGNLHAQTNAAPAAAAPSGYDFGDSKSVTLTTKAWQALNGKDYAAVAAYTDKCITLYKDTAVQQQGSLKEAADKDSAATYWALNDVGTCYFIAGKALDDKGDKKSAIAAYKFPVDNLSFAQCLTPKGPRRLRYPPCEATSGTNCAKRHAPPQ